jgi:hypothetical protein
MLVLLEFMRDFALTTLIVTSVAALGVGCVLLFKICIT